MSSESDTKRYLELQKTLFEELQEGLVIGKSYDIFLDLGVTQFMGTYFTNMRVVDITKGIIDTIGESKVWDANTTNYYLKGEFVRVSHAMCYLREDIVVIKEQLCRAKFKHTLDRWEELGYFEIDTNPEIKELDNKTPSLIMDYVKIKIPTSVGKIVEGEFIPHPRDITIEISVANCNIRDVFMEEN